MLDLAANNGIIPTSHEKRHQANDVHDLQDRKSPSAYGAAGSFAPSFSAAASGLGGRVTPAEKLRAYRVAKRLAGKCWFCLEAAEAPYSLCGRHREIRRETGRNKALRLPAELRFWSHVNIVENKACWPWLGTKVSNNYGVFWYKNKRVLAHRMAWMLANVDVEKHQICHGLCVIHTCDNPPCVNPYHLRLGTQRDNLLDMVLKGRTANPILLRWREQA